MPTPFPGMDPYLERPHLWPDVHNSLITALRDELAPLLRPRYYVSIEERIYLVEPGGSSFSGRPDVAVVGESPPVYETVTTTEITSDVIMVEVSLPDHARETYLEVRAANRDKVVTVLEILSPANKRPGEGQYLYRRKRDTVLCTPAHLVEIDLLRAGEPMPMQGDVPDTHYRLLISRSERRPTAELRVFNVRQPIPSFHLPLQDGDEESSIDLGQLLHELYDRAGYDLRVDYRAEPEPPLEGDDAAWADALLRQAELR
jgi:hypothetical protein